MILRDARILVGPYDLSGDHNEISLTVGMTDVDGTRFGHRAEAVVAGLGMIECTGSGFVRPGPDGPDRALRGQLGIADVPITIMSGDPTVDDVAIESFIAQTFQYRSGAPVGQLFPFTWTARAQGQMPASGGQLATARPITASGVGTVYQRDIVAGDRVVATLHVTRVSGGGSLKLVVVIESDSNVNFNNPIARGTFPDVTAPGAWRLAIVGPVSDDFWRAKWTVTGTNPSFDVVLALGRE